MAIWNSVVLEKTTEYITTIMWTIKLRYFKTNQLYHNIHTNPFHSALLLTSLPPRITNIGLLLLSLFLRLRKSYLISRKFQFDYSQTGNVRESLID